MDWITLAFLADGIVLMFSYVPQWRDIVRSTTGARDVNIVSWLYWTFSTLIGSGYAIFVNKALPLTLVVVGLLVCNAITLALLVRARVAYRI